MEQKYNNAILRNTTKKRRREKLNSTKDTLFAAMPIFLHYFIALDFLLLRFELVYLLFFNLILIATSKISCTLLNFPKKMQFICFSFKR